MRKLGKCGKTSGGMKVLMGLGGVAIIVFMLAQFGVLEQITGVDEEDELRITECSSETSPNLSVKAYDRETGTALTEATNLYRVKGQKTWSTFTAGTGFGANANDVLEIVMGVDTTDFTDNAYGQMKEVIVECKETPEVEFEMVSDEVETSLVATFLDTDENANAETYVAGQTQDVFVKLQAGTKEYFGNPYLPANSNVIVLDLNSTEWDTPEKVAILGGEELNAVSVPIRHSAVAGLKAYAYELPVITDTSVKIALTLNADDSVAPATDMTAYMYASNYFYNADTQEIEFGVENEEGTAVGTDASDSLTLDFTA